GPDDVHDRRLEVTEPGHTASLGHRIRRITLACSSADFHLSTLGIKVLVDGTVQRESGSGTATTSSRASSARTAGLDSSGRLPSGFPLRSGHAGRGSGLPTPSP